MLAMAEHPRNGFYFSPAHAVDYCSTLEKFQHTTAGLWTRRENKDASIVLEPWQVWIETAIHGFRYHVTNERVVSRAYEEEPRKSAKSERMGGAIIYDLCFSGEVQPEILIGAPNEEATNRVFNPTKRMMQAEPELLAEYGIKLTSKFIKSFKTDGDVIKLNSQGEKKDGYNPSLSVMEEMHAQPESVYRVVRSAMGARPNALMRIITTAGYHASGVGYSLRKEAESLLSGHGEDDFSLFAVIYTIDDEDYLKEDGEVDVNRLLTDTGLMMKANPMWGISVDPEKILQQANEAKRSADKRGEFLRTRYNIWNNAGASLIDPMQWKECEDKKLSIDRFMGQKCWLGVDLASEQDMCAIGAVFEMPGDILAVFCTYFIPRFSPTFTDPDLYSSMMSWEQDGHLVVTEGGMADYDRIEDEIRSFAEVFDVRSISFDPYQANQTTKRLWAEGLPVGRYPNTAATMTAPTDNLLARVSSKRIAHNGHPILAWNAANVHGERKGNGSIMPRKDAPNSKRKIDGWVALTMANGSLINPDGLKTDKAEKTLVSAYANRGIIGHGN